LLFFRILTGLGRQACIRVKTDGNSGQMSVDHLKQLLSTQEGSPVVLVATYGTDITGAVDNIQEISQLCEQHKMWLHVDGNHAGPYIFSKTLKDPCLHLADSFSLGGSLLPVPECCTVLVTKWEGTFKKVLVFSTEKYNQQRCFHSFDRFHTDICNN
jgi:glutamate/tyrosine decarboxylase-like PLP-dependent enzyme